MRLELLRCPLWARLMLVSIFILGFQGYSPDASAVWTAAGKDPVTGKPMMKQVGTPPRIKDSFPVSQSVGQELNAEFNSKKGHGKTDFVKTVYTGKPRAIQVNTGITSESASDDEGEDKVSTASEHDKESVRKPWKHMSKGEKAKILKPFKNLSKESATCASCHRTEHPGIYQQWGRSKHYGANVGCYECHKADKDDPDAIRHKDFTIAVIVSPKDCGECHNVEADQFSKSHHAKAAEIIGSLDNTLAEVVEGDMSFHGKSPVAVNGCWQCHGIEVKVLPNGELDPTTWPNTGIGRINPDGS